MHAEAGSRALARVVQLRASASISEFDLASFKTLANSAVDSVVNPTADHTHQHT